MSGYTLMVTMFDKERLEEIMELVEEKLRDPEFKPEGFVEIEIVE